MPDIAKTPTPDRFNWLLAIYAAGAALLVSIGIAIADDWDLIGIAYVWVVLPILSGSMLIAAGVAAFGHRPRKALSILLASIIYVGTSWALVQNVPTVRPYVLWTLHSGKYKSSVLAQSADNHGLKHFEWYGWGFVGSDTTAYLVYDPANSLAHKNSKANRYDALPCDVWKVQHLEDHWYAVTFYTDEGWDERCDTAQSSPQSLATSP